MVRVALESVQVGFGRIVVLEKYVPIILANIL
jgi:hypothetical protein